MKKIVILSILCLAFPLLAVHNDSSEIIPANNFFGGIHLGVSTTPGPQTYVSAGLGINEWSDLRLRVGYLDYAKNTNSVYSGLYYKILITRFFQKMDSVSVQFGPQYHKYFSLYSSLLLTTSWKVLQFYTGLDDSIYFAPAGTEIRMNFLIGTKVKFKWSLTRISPALNFEVAVPVLNKTSYAFSLSLLNVFDYKSANK